MKIMVSTLALLGASVAVHAEPQTPTTPTEILMAAKTASGGAAWDKIDRIRLTSTLSGDETGTLVDTEDLRNGRSTFDELSGPNETIKGADSGIWLSSHGVVGDIDLPAAVADQRSEVYLAQAGWRFGAPEAKLAPGAGRTVAGVDLTPPGGSPLTLWFDTDTHLLKRAIAHRDDGDHTIDYSDYRAVSGVMIPFRREQLNPAGARTLTVVNSVDTKDIPDTALQRPKDKPRGELANNAAVEVPFQFSDFDRGNIIVPAMIEGKPASVLFDTGAWNLMTPESVRAFDLKPAGDLTVQGIDEGFSKARFVAINSINIGGARLYDQTGVAMDLPYTLMHARAGAGINGLVGQQFLTQFRTTFDYAHRQIRFTPFNDPPPVGAVVRFYTSGRNTLIPAKINGVEGLFLLDTGNSGYPILFRRFADTHGLFPSAAGNVGGVTGDLELGGVTLKNTPIGISDTHSGAFASHSIAGNIGEEVLRRYTITIDRRAHTVTFVPNAQITEPFNLRQNGLILDQSGPDAIEVAAVTPNSTAEQAGLQVGDSITAINGQSVLDKGLGIFDLIHLGEGTAPIRLELKNHGLKRNVTLLSGEK